MNVYKYQELADKIQESYNQESFAEVLGIKRHGLYMKLKGKRKFTKLEKQKIKELFDIDIE